MWSAIAARWDIFHGHKYTSSLAEASAKAVKAGTDLTCGNEYVSLVEAVQKHFITEAEIDQSLRRLFVARFRSGLFDAPAKVPYSNIGMDKLPMKAIRNWRWKQPKNRWSC